jgi:FtsZ-binding cell division protein ZapB
MSKRAREEEEDGEITNTQILDELSVLKEEVDFLREDNKILSRQYADAADQRDKYKSRLNRRKEGARKWKEDLDDEYP